MAVPLEHLSPEMESAWLIADQPSMVLFTERHEELGEPSSFILAVRRTQEGF